MCTRFGLFNWMDNEDCCKDNDCVFLRMEETRVPLYSGTLKIKLVKSRTSLVFCSQESVFLLFY